MLRTLKTFVGGSVKPISCHVGTPTSASLMPGRVRSTGGSGEAGPGRAAGGLPTRSTSFSKACGSMYKGIRGSPMLHVPIIARSSKVGGLPTRSLQAFQRPAAALGVPGLRRSRTCLEQPFRACSAHLISRSHTRARCPTASFLQRLQASLVQGNPAASRTHLHCQRWLPLVLSDKHVGVLSQVQACRPACDRVRQAHTPTALIMCASDLIAPRHRSSVGRQKSLRLQPPRCAGTAQLRNNQERRTSVWAWLLAAHQSVE